MYPNDPFAYETLQLPAIRVDIPPDEQEVLSDKIAETIDLTFLGNDFSEVTSNSYPIDIDFDMAPSPVFKELMPVKQSHVCIQFEVERKDIDPVLKAAILKYTNDTTSHTTEVLLIGDEFTRQDGSDLVTHTAPDGTVSTTYIDARQRIALLEGTLELASLDEANPNLSTLEMLQKLVYLSSQVVSKRKGTYALNPVDKSKNQSGVMSISLYDETLFEPKSESPLKKIQHGMAIHVLQGLDENSMTQSQLAFSTHNGSHIPEYGVFYEFKGDETRNYWRLLKADRSKYTDTGYEYPTRFAEDILKVIARLFENNHAPNRLNMQRILDENSLDSPDTSTR